MKDVSRHLFAVVSALLLGSLFEVTPAIGADKDEKEVSLSVEELKRLDTFEAHTLAKADQVFIKQQFRQALAEYDSFILEFPRSKLIPYALLRKGRCSQLDAKRFQAIAVYREILDYFPNDVKYAAAALFYVGDCHFANGDLQKAMKAWAEMAEDKEYRKQYLAAPAINHLADQLMKQEKEAEAVKHYEQVAVDFRKDNHNASVHARDPVIRHYVLTDPSEPNFRRFYTNMRTFEHNPRTVEPNLNEDKTYWDVLRHYIRHHGNSFTTSSNVTTSNTDEKVAQARKSFYTYWSGQMQGKFTSSLAAEIEYGDGFHIELANFRLAAAGDQGAWYQYLDGRYNRLQKSGNWQRTARWMALYAGNATKVEQYYKKVNFADVDNDARVAVMKALWETPETKPLARKLMDKLDFGKMTNDELGQAALHFHEDDQVLSARFIGKIDFKKMTGTQTGSLARSFWPIDQQLSKMLLPKIRYGEIEDKEIAGIAGRFWDCSGEVVRDVCLRTKDQAYGKFELLRYYHDRHRGWNPSAGLPLADGLVKVDRYATEAWWAKAEFHESLKEYAKAIAAFQNCQNEPANLWRIAHCHWKLKKPTSAFTQLREIENFFPKEGSKAAMQTAHWYRDGGDKKKYIAALRSVLKKYPDSDQSKEAHELLEKEGYKTGGGVDAN
ncbi:MAG: tetratricopeptide repeat protein [Candidatus Nealsonbacteria bacterium]|nr:tetratricopeptide repeat protein [Candidatus Nealsonbacteria bacterium]